MSYDPESLEPLDRARSALGDTDTVELLTDDHIEMVIGANGFNQGVVSLANELAVRFARKPGSVRLPSGLSVTWPERVAEWRRVASRYSALAAQEASAASIPLTSRAKTIARW
jgi:hypothetical protein